MEPDELEFNSRNRKRINPAIGLVLFLVFVSALLIHQIQRRQQARLQPPVAENYTPAVSHAPAEAKSVQTESNEVNPEPLQDPVIPEAGELVMTQVANRSPLLPAVGTLKEGELDSTSWQNPFYGLLWKNKGWTFTEEGMESTPNQYSAATFVRPYQKISVSFDVEAAEKLPPFDLQLLTRDPAHPEAALVTSSVHFEPEAISVSTKIKEASKEIKRAPLRPEEIAKAKRARIRFVGTGNRFVISVGRRRVLTCTQAAQQSGKTCYLSFVADGAPVKITALRIEGE